MANADSVRISGRSRSFEPALISTASEIPFSTSDPSLAAAETRLVRSATAPVAIYRKTPSLSSYQTTPITKHYALNNQILEAFESHYENKLYTVAYAIGLKFVETALLEIPKHGYFYSQRHQEERMQSSLDAIRVTHLLHEIIAMPTIDQGGTTPTTNALNPPAASREKSQTKRKNNAEKNNGTNNQKQVKPPRSPVKATKMETETTTTSRPKPPPTKPGMFGPTEKEKIEKLKFLAMQQCERASVGEYEEIRRTVEQELDQMYLSDASSSEQQKAQSLLMGTSTSSSIRRKSSKVTRMKPKRYSSTTGTTHGTKSSNRSSVATPPPMTTNRRQSTLTSTLWACGDTFSNVLCPGTLSGGSGGSEYPPQQPTQYEAVFSTDHDVLSKPTIHDGSSCITKPHFDNQRRMSDLSLQRVLFLSGLEMTPSQHNLLDDVPENDSVEQHMHLTPTAKQVQNEVRNSNHEHEAHSVASAKIDNAEDGNDASCDTSNVLPISMLTQCYHEDFDSLRKIGRVQISRVPTYQGRVPDSTNGCTVIAPLLCIHHFHNVDDDHDLSRPDPGLLDSVIVQVIDDETPNILPQVRENLGLVRDAFLIPSDAHDSLMAQQYMCPEQFVTVCGGNILDDSHLQSLVDALNTPGPKKLAATLFFHEHVITILQLRRGSVADSSKQKVWYDIIDSLPHEETLIQAQIEESPFAAAVSLMPSAQYHQLPAPLLNGSNYNNGHQFESEPTFSSSNDGKIGSLVDVLPNDYEDADGAAFDYAPPPNAARIRCLDDDSLKATLKWYACSVFTEENMAYIDMYTWDVMNSDFDPRVYQAFIWTEA